MTADEKKKIKVTDRRLFTPDGELRGGSDSPAEPEPPSDDAGPRPTPMPEGTGEKSPESALPPPGAGAAAVPEPTFFHLLSVLAEPIALFLGDARIPGGESVENLDLASFHIDLLDMLRRKTEGNLTTDESKMLEELLYQLRMRYVQKRG